MEIVKASDILSLEKIKKGELKNVLPELYELKEILENNDWHENDSTFNHALAALESLERLFKDVRDEILDYLNQKVDGYTRKELLFLAALFHDVAKKETIVKEAEKTSFPHHDSEGAIKAVKILSRFDLSEEEKNLVSETIRQHLIIQDILKPFRDNPDLGIKEVKKKYPNIFWELILLGYADTLGCQPNRNTIDEFNARLKFYKQILF